MKEVKLKGLNLNKFLQRLMKEKIFPKSIEMPCHDELDLTLTKKDYNKIIKLKIVDEFNLTILQDNLKLGFGFKLLTRSGLIVGLLCSLMFVFNYTQKIWSINILVEGESLNLLTNKTLNILDEMGIKRGQDFSFTNKEVEKELLVKLEDVSNVVVNRDGTSLNIFVKESNKLLTSSGADIVAGFSGIVEKIDLTSGVLECNIGEAVLEGQILISSDTIGDLYTEAVGDVVAKVNVCGDAVGAIDSKSVKRSGVFESFCYYEICGKSFGLKKFDEISKKYPYFEVEKEEVYVSPNLFLPLKKIKLTIFELDQLTNIEAHDNLIENLKQKAYNIARNNLPSGASEDSVTYDVFNDGNYYRVVCNIETVISIGKRQQK